MPRAKRLLVLCCLLWAGMLLGISFLEAWVKFQAPSLTRAVGLDVGVTVFSALQLTEIIWLALIGLLIATGGQRSRATLAGGLTLAVSIALQRWLLMPELSAQAAIIIAGGDHPGSWHHLAYGIIEVIKLATLLTLAWQAMAESKRQQQDQSSS